MRPNGRMVDSIAQEMTRNMDLSFLDSLTCNKSNTKGGERYWTLSPLLQTIGSMLYHRMRWN